MISDNILEIKNLQTQIATHKVHDGLSMSVKKGEVFGIVGGSGTGKTVLLNTILGLFPHSGGTVSMFGVDSSQIHQSFDYKKRMGILFQQGALFSSLTVLQNICVPMIEQGGIARAEAEEIAFYKLGVVGLSTEAAHKLPEELSGGMVKRAALARCLALDADLIFLDEPTSGLDLISAEKFDRLILRLKETLGLSVVMITHDLGSLAICDHIGVIVDKKMITGTLAEIRKNPHPWIREYFTGTRSKAMLAGK